MNARRTGIASAATLSGLALALGLAHAVAPEWVKRVGLDLWNLPALRLEARAVDDEAALLQVKADQEFRRTEMGSHIAGQLADGSLTLAEAVAVLEPIM